ncbi:hypothetical protein ACN6KF_005672 [Labrys sp. La1]|uniref:hypothetical protein n=1 Tax=Labrys sp. La1 TaxID=3404917 RepID=UPI003EB9965A
MMTETVEMVGFTSLVAPSHIIFGNVVAWEPETKMAITTSSKEAMKARVAPARML